MSDIDKKYEDILRKCKFISKKDEWFVEGTEVKVCDVWQYEVGYKFKDGCGLFEGLTNETYSWYVGELPRHDSEVCPLDEFLIYDELGNEISELTLEEYKKLLNISIL